MRRMNLTEAKTFGLDGFQPKTDGIVASLWVFGALLEISGEEA